MEETRLVGHVGRVRGKKRPDFNSRASWLHLRTIGKPELKLIAVGLVFIALNAGDAYLTNIGHHMASSAGAEQNIEANPFLQSLVGSWVLGFKGLVGIAAIGLLAWVKHFSPSTLFRWLIFGCGVILAIIIWNLYSLGVIG